MPIYLEPESLQKIVNEFKKTGKDFEVVNANEVIIADVNTEDVGNVLGHDTGNEVGLVIRTGKPQTFVEVSKDYPAGINLIAVPMKHEGKIVGAVITQYSAGQQAEGQSVAEAFVTSITSKPSSIPVYSEKESLQSYVEELSKAMKRDIVVMDSNKVIIADTDPEEIGT